MTTMKTFSTEVEECSLGDLADFLRIPEHERRKFYQAASLGLTITILPGALVPA